MENKIARNQDDGVKRIMVWRERQRTEKANQVMIKEKPTAISFFFSNFPDHVTQDDLQKVFAKYGQVVDVYVSKNINKFGKRFGFVKFTNIGDDVQTFVTLLNTIWIGSFKLRVNIDRRNYSKCSVTHREIKGEQSVKITRDDQKRSDVGLPMDILSSIARRLALIDLLSFRCTCKDFLTASSEIVEFSTPLWLQFHKTNRCSRYIGYDDKDNSKKYYGINIPRLGTIRYLLGAGHGWELLYSGESIFFLAGHGPGDTTRIVLPDFPKRDMYHNVGVFSDAPTSPHCVVCVFDRVTEKGMTEVDVICHGQSVWTRHKVRTPFWSSSRALYYTARTFDHESQTFYHTNSNIDRHYYVKVSVKDGKWIPSLVKTSVDSVMPICLQHKISGWRI